MADLFLIFATLVAFCILLVVGVYLIVYYQHPDDHNDAYFPKLVVLFGFVLCGCTALLLPLDVANNEGYAGCDGYDTNICGGLDMELFWNVIFWLIPIWTFVLIPFATFYYEADDGMLMAGTSVAPNAVKKSKLAQALCAETVVLVFFGVLFLVTYLLASDTDIPIQHYEVASISQMQASQAFHTTEDKGENATFTISDLADISSNEIVARTSFQQPPNSEVITLQVDVSTFYAGLMAWMGWFFFAIFGGIGLAALPLDSIMAFVNRPRHMDAVEFAEVKMGLQQRVNELVEIGELLKVERETKKAEGSTPSYSLFDSSKRNEFREEQKAHKEFKAAVYLMEKDVEDYNAVSANYEKYNPLTPYISLLIGFFSFLISLAWLIQICIYIFPDQPIHPFLNSFFMWFDGWFPLFGVLSVAIFTMYLLFCAIKGCFKFGLRFMLIDLHPMRVGRTYMSSFMFNIALVLLCSLPVVQFATTAFADYARFTNIRQIYGIQVENLNFFGWFWTNNVFIYAFLSFFALTTFYLICKPKDKSGDSAELRDRLKNRGA